MTSKMGRMQTSRLGVACLVAVIAAGGVASVLDRPVHTQRSTACACPDVTDLINRLNMDDAAIEALKQEIPKIEAADKAAGTPSRMTDRNGSGRTNYETIRDTIQDAINSRQIKGTLTSSAETDSYCNVTLKRPSTACMDEVVTFHEEQVHKPACDRDFANGRTILGRRDPATTADYAREEIAGYQSEIDRIRQILKSLPDSCRPGDWIGMIYYFEEKSLSGSTTVSTSGALASTSTQTGTASFKREAKILYRETGSSTGDVSIEEKTKRHDVGSGRTSCIGGAATAVPDRTVTTTTEETTDAHGSGSSDVNASFDFDPQTSKVTLAFEIPGTIATAAMHKTDRIEGACQAADNGTKTTPSAEFSTSYDKSSMTVEGFSPGSRDVVRGSKRIDLAPQASIPNVSLSHQATVSWVFYKVQ